MIGHVLLNLLNKLGKRDKMRDLQNIGKILVHRKQEQQI